MDIEDLEAEHHSVGNEIKRILNCKNKKIFFVKAYCNESLEKIINYLVFKKGGYKISGNISCGSVGRPGQLCFCQTIIKEEGKSWFF